MPVSVEYTNEFEAWWDGLTARHQDAVGRVVANLIDYGPSLPFPYSSGVRISRHPHMRELRIQTRPPIRVFYAFDPRRTAILLVGGHKTTGDRFYRQHVRRADLLYDQHLQELADERRHPDPNRGGPSR